MTPRDWFTVGLRLIGIWQFIETFGNLVAIIGVDAGYYRTQYTTLGCCMIAAFSHFAVAVWLLTFAPQTTRFFYPDTKPNILRRSELFWTLSLSSWSGRR